MNSPKYCKKKKHKTWGHEVAIAVRSGVRIIASVELSMSSREIFLEIAILMTIAMSFMITEYMPQLPQLPKLQS